MTWTFWNLQFRIFDEIENVKFLFEAEIALKEAAQTIWGIS